MIYYDIIYVLPMFTEHRPSFHQLNVAPSLCGPSSLNRSSENLHKKKNRYKEGPLLIRFFVDPSTIINHSISIYVYGDIYIYMVIYIYINHSGDITITNHRIISP